MRGLRHGLLISLVSLALCALAVTSASATIYSNPGPMPPKAPNCEPSGYGYEAMPCAATSKECSHIVAPAFAAEGQIVIARTDPPVPCNAWYYSEIPGEQLSPCYLPAESSGYIEEYGGVGLNECKFRVNASFSTIWHINSASEWERTTGPGWVKVGIDDICGYGCSEYESDDETWMAVQPPPPPPEEPKKEGTTHPRPGLEVSYGTNPEPVLVKQTAKGAEPQSVKFTVTVKNTASTPITNVTLTDPLHITPVGHIPHGTDVSGCTWAQGTPFGKPLTSATKGAAPASPPCPLSEEKGPGAIGTLASGESKSATFTLLVGGDGDYTLYPEISGEREGETNGEPVEDPVNYVGKYEFKPETQLLMFSASLGSKIASPTNPKLIQAGTHYIIKVHLENRSTYQQLQVDPIEPELRGNAMGGELVPAGASSAVKPSGSLEQVSDTPVLKLEPGEKRDYAIVVNTEGSDTFANQGASTGNGTRSTVIFSSPEIATVNEDKPSPTKPEDQVVMEPGSTEFNVGIDQSQPAPPPFTWPEAAFYFSKGLVYGLWGATYGTVHGIFDLANLAAKTVLNVPTATLNEINYLTELWYATSAEPGAHKALVEAVMAKVETAYLETPYLLEESKEKLEQTISNAIDAYFGKIATAWIAGDWREALQDVTETGTNVGATALGPAALKVAAGTMGRMSLVADAWTAKAASAYEKVAAELAAASSKIEPAVNALKALKDVLPGYRFTIPELQKFFGVSATEADWLSEFTKAKKISVVFRSRAEESIEWLKKGAMLKPYWVKAKNVSWLDVQWLGYKAEDVGRVVMREPPSLAYVEADLAENGVTAGTTEYQEVIERWQERKSNYLKELHEMEKWNKARDIKGKWPWQENGVDPTVQADESFRYKFRLVKDAHDPGALVPEIFNPQTKKWGSITGDIDLIAITKADGAALSDAEHVKILKELRTSPFGSQHPESLTWTKGDKFWFDKKKSYLTDEDLVQAGPDGVFRSVKFNEKLSDPENWTKLNYRVFWNGGYATGTGQVSTAAGAALGGTHLVSPEPE
jgi:hypothetical protein